MINARWVLQAPLAALRERLGPELYSALLRVSELFWLDAMNDRRARRMLSQLRCWMGWRHWAALVQIIEHGTLTTGMRGHPDIHAAIRAGRDALVMVIEWEGERMRWGLEPPPPPTVMPTDPPEEA